MHENENAQIISTFLPHWKDGIGIQGFELYLKVKEPSKNLCEGIEIVG